MIPFLVLMTIENEDDRLFLERLYVEYHTLMYGMALRVTRNSDLAQDAVSDSLMALMKKIDLLRTLECNKLRSYVVITVKHTAITLLNRGKREMAADDATFQDLTDGYQVDDRVLAKAGVEGVKNAIRRLPDRERDIMLMRYFREMDDREIADALGLKPVSVRVQLSRARKHLAALLGREGNE
ncbi:MAG: sigma-70 family RNA polymerase sigma factor [Clostridia bacterium]|nr:sigma-70 family RNA polymerase sigma factor [Clostridia bacterium]